MIAGSVIPGLGRYRQKDHKFKATRWIPGQPGLKETLPSPAFDLKIIQYDIESARHRALYSNEHHKYFKDNNNKYKMTAFFFKLGLTPIFKTLVFSLALFF